jgi:hypothetical protein
MMWQGMVDRGAKAGDYPSLVKAAINLAFDFLIANDFNACFGMDVNGWERVFGCVATALNAIGIGKLAGILAKITKVKALVRAGESVDKFRDTYKTISNYSTFCKIAKSPNVIEKILGLVKAEAAGCKTINLISRIDTHIKINHLGVSDDFLKARLANINMATRFSTESKLIKSIDSVDLWLQTDEGIDFAKLVASGKKGQTINLSIGESVGNGFEVVNSVTTKIDDLSIVKFVFDADGSGGIVLNTAFPIK